MSEYKPHVYATYVKPTCSTSPTNDTIDLRDVWDRFSEVRAELETAYEEGGGFEPGPPVAWLLTAADDPKLKPFVEEYHSLRKLVEELERHGALLDNLDGGTLVNHRHWKDWVREKMEDREAQRHWGIDFSAAPYCHIDWELVAKDEATDYSILEWEGESFFVVLDN